jgi:hypothetical protein
VEEREGRRRGTAAPSKLFGQPEGRPPARPRLRVSEGNDRRCLHAARRGTAAPSKLFGQPEGRPPARPDATESLIIAQR